MQYAPLTAPAHMVKIEFDQNCLLHPSETLVAPNLTAIRMHTGVHRWDIAAAAGRRY